MPNIDERLLAGKTLRPEEEGEAAEELKNRRNGGEKEENQGGSLRQRVQAARQAMDLKAMAKKKEELVKQLQLQAEDIKNKLNKLFKIW